MTDAKPLPSVVRRRAQNPTLKLILEMGPLVLFFLTNWKFGIFPATGVLMAGVIIALIASWVLTRHLPIMPVVTAVAVVVFGALTFFFHDDLFIKLKPTIVNTIFGTVLLGGLALGRPLLPVVLDSVLQLDEEGWRKLTFRWGVFFYLLAIVNESRLAHADDGFLGELQGVRHHAADHRLRARAGAADHEIRVERRRREKCDHW